MTRIYGKLDHRNFGELAIPMIYAFASSDVFLKSKFIAIERGFSLERCSSAYEEKQNDEGHCIYSGKHFKIHLKSPSMRSLIRRA